MENPKFSINDRFVVTGDGRYEGYIGTIIGVTGGEFYQVRLDSRGAQAETYRLSLSEYIMEPVSSLLEDDQP